MGELHGESHDAKMLAEPALYHAAETGQHQRKTDPAPDLCARCRTRLSRNLSIPRQQQQGGDVEWQDGRIQHLTAVTEGDATCVAWELVRSYTCITESTPR